MLLPFPFIGIFSLPPARFIFAAAFSSYQAAGVAA
jgi:hypothetical protein